LYLDALPLAPSQTGFPLVSTIHVFERGEKVLRGGEAPSSIYTPLQPEITTVSRKCLRPERGKGRGKYIPTKCKDGYTKGKLSFLYRLEY
jgi:hypothetical protein